MKSPLIQRAFFYYLFKFDFDTFTVKTSQTEQFSETADVSRFHIHQRLDGKAHGFG